MESAKRQAVFSWVTVGALALLCGILAVLQYRWIAEVSVAQADRLRNSLQASLHGLSRVFNAEISGAFRALVPTGTEVDQAGREAAYQARYARWRSNTQRDNLFRRIALVVPHGEGSTELKLLHQQLREFRAADWPAEWDAMRQMLAGGCRRGQVGRSCSFSRT